MQAFAMEKKKKEMKRQNVVGGGMSLSNVRKNSLRGKKGRGSAQEGCCGVGGGGGGGGQGGRGSPVSMVFKSPKEEKEWMLRKGGMV